MRKYSKVYKKKTKIFSKIKIINSREKQQKDVFCPEHHFLSLKAEPTPPGFTCSDIIKSSLARRKRSDKTIWQTERWVKFSALKLRPQSCCMKERDEKFQPTVISASAEETPLSSSG